jgi:hypothetical protein
MVRIIHNMALSGLFDPLRANLKREEHSESSM